jgi:ATP:corrinoid adenosyltransferase
MILAATTNIVPGTNEIRGKRIAGKKVLFAQFIKGNDYSEIKAMETYLPGITIKQYGLGRFISGTPKPEDILSARKGLSELSEAVSSAKYDVIVMDEANVALNYSLSPISSPCCSGKPIIRK